MNLLQCLLDGVGDLLQVDLAHDVESIYWHADLPKNCANQPLRVPEEAELTPWNFFFVRFSQSEEVVEIAGCHASDFFGRNTAQFAQLAGDFLYECRFVPLASMRNGRQKGRVGRSEEHTSELQSPCNLVCRLLLEKKKSSIAFGALRRACALRLRAWVS